MYFFIMLSMHYKPQFENNIAYEWWGSYHFHCTQQFLGSTAFSYIHRLDCNSKLTLQQQFCGCFESKILKSWNLIILWSSFQMHTIFHSLWCNVISDVHLPHENLVHGWPYYLWNTQMPHHLWDFLIRLHDSYDLYTAHLYMQIGTPAFWDRRD